MAESLPVKRFWIALDILEVVCGGVYLLIVIAAFTWNAVDLALKAL